MSQDLPDPGTDRLRSLYREAATDEPGPALDRFVLEAARSELDAVRAARSRPAPWWKSWLPATTAIAAVLIGVSVTWRVMDEQERRLRQEMNAAEAPERAAPSKADSGAAADAVPATPARARRAEDAVRDLAPPAAPVSAAPATGVEAQAFPATPPTAVRPSAEPESKKPRPMEIDALRERRDAGVASDAATGTASNAPAAAARQAGKLEAGTPGLGATGEAAAGPSPRPAAKFLAAPAADPAAGAWLRQIRELRAAGRSAEAAQSLARFRARYPDFPVPADLADLKGP